jgi:hypothetical protein
MAAGGTPGNPVDDRGSPVGGARVGSPGSTASAISGTTNPGPRQPESPPAAERIDLTQVRGSVRIPVWTDGPLALAWSQSGADGELAVAARVGPPTPTGDWPVSGLRVGSSALPGIYGVGYRAGVLTQVAGDALPPGTAVALIEAVRAVAFTVAAVPAGDYAGGDHRPVVGSTYAVGAAAPTGLRLVSAQDLRSAEGRSSAYPAEPGRADEVVVDLRDGRVARVARIVASPAADDAPAFAQRLTLTPIDP